MVQAGRRAQHGRPNLGRVAGLEGAGGRGDVKRASGGLAGSLVVVTRPGPEIARPGVDSLFEAGQIRGQPLRQLRMSSGQGGDAVPDLRHASGRHEELAGGQQHHLVYGVKTALVGGIEGPHRVDLVAEELDPNGQRRGRWEYVDEPSAPGELTATGHFEDGVVTERKQVAEQSVLVKARADLEAAGLGRNLLRVQGVLEERLNAGNQDPGPAGAPGGQRGDACGGLVADQLAAFVGQRGPRLQHGHRVGIAQPRLQLLGHAIADLRVASHPAEPLPDDRRHGTAGWRRRGRPGAGTRP